MNEENLNQMIEILNKIEKHTKFVKNFIIIMIVLYLAWTLFFQWLFIGF